MSWGLPVCGRGFRWCGQVGRWCGQVEGGGRFSKWRAERRGGRRGCRAASAAAAGELGAEGVEARLPEAAERVEPFVGGGQLGGLDRVEATGAIRVDGREARLAQHPEVLGHGRLRYAELLVDHAAQLSGGGLSVGEQLEDAASHGISEDVEGVHIRIIAWWLI
jgi:hypothetical protein